MGARVMICNRFVAWALLVLLLVPVACAAHEWKEARFSGEMLCLHPKLDWKESRISEIIGSYLREVYTLYPFTFSTGAARTLDVSIAPMKQGFPAVSMPTESVPDTDAALGLLVWQAPNGDEFFKDPLGGFEVRCPNTRYRVCYRRFQTDLVVGNYVIPRDALSDWREWERGLTSFLGEGAVRRCADVAVQN